MTTAIRLSGIFFTANRPICNSCDPEKAITIRIWQFDVWGFSILMPPIVGGVSASKSLIQPNEEVTFTATASGNPTGYEWTVEGGTLVSETGNQAVYTFANTGFYNVTLKATNIHGTSDPRTFKKVVEVSKAVVKGRYPLAMTGFNADLIAERRIESRRGCISNCRIIYLSLPSLRTARNEVGSNPVFINDYRTFHLLAESQNFHNRRS
ncbi:hypothetical protein FACS189413_11950 [Bacteroidia bacterium]|nr:hypothetical protein FACS189413_11950 [Bacteroidia bacterium]